MRFFKKNLGSGLKICTLSGWLIFSLHVKADDSLVLLPNDIFDATKDVCEKIPANQLNKKWHSIHDKLRAGKFPSESFNKILFLIMRNSRNSAFEEFNFIKRTPILTDIIESSAFKDAIDQCYLDDDVAKNAFIEHVKQRDTAGKAIVAVAFLGISSLYSKALVYLGSAAKTAAAANFWIKLGPAAATTPFLTGDTLKETKPINLLELIPGNVEPFPEAAEKEQELRNKDFLLGLSRRCLSKYQELLKMEKNPKIVESYQHKLSNCKMTLERLIGERARF